MKQKYLWQLKAIDFHNDDEILIIASSQEEAENKWDERYGDDGYLGRSITKIDIVDNHKIMIQEL